MSRKPLAPMRSAWKTYSPASKVVSISDRGVEVGVGQDALGRLQAVELGHPDVHEDDVRAPAAHEVDCGAPVARLADDGQVGLGVDDDAEPGAQQPLIVGDEDRDGPCGRRGRLVGGRGVVGVASSSQATRATATASPSPAGAARPRDAGGRASAAPGHLAHDVGDEDLALAGRVAEPAGDVDRRAVEVGAVGDRLAGVEPDAQREPVAAPRRWRAASSIAQRTAATALAKTTISPSPVDLTSRPPWAATAARSASKCARRSASARLVAEAVEQRRRPDEVREEDRDELGLHRRRASSPLRRPASPSREERRRRGSPARMTTGRPAGRQDRPMSHQSPQRGPQRDAALHGARRRRRRLRDLRSRSLQRARRPPHGRERQRGGVRARRSPPSRCSSWSSVPLLWRRLRAAGRRRGVLAAVAPAHRALRLARPLRRGRSPGVLWPSPRAPAGPRARPGSGSASPSRASSP